jgi:hypothetical protein
MRHLSVESGAALARWKAVALVPVWLSVGDLQSPFSVSLSVDQARELVPELWLVARLLSSRLCLSHLRGLSLPSLPFPAQEPLLLLPFSLSFSERQPALLLRVSSLSFFFHFCLSFYLSFSFPPQKDLRKIHLLSSPFSSISFLDSIFQSD